MSTGFEFISEMSKEELMAEIIEHHRGILDSMDITQLRANVVDLRVNEYKKRLAKEAGVVPTPFGYATRDDEDDD